MGNSLSCCGGSRKAKADRARGWEATGIVGLRDQKLKELPLDVAKIKDRASTLDVTHNKIARIPDFVLEFSVLQRLLLTDNVLIELPASIGNLSSLKILNVDNNQLSSLPDSVGNLTNLEKLSVASNNIAALPDTVGRLGRLRQLEVGTNKLRHLPESLATCAELEIINSVDNYLEDIPEGFGQLRKLRTLALDNNRISRVPTAVLKGCIALQTLQLHSNPITPQVLESTDGWEDYESRRQTKANKVIAGGAMIGDGTMDEGVDRRARRS